MISKNKAITGLGIFFIILGITALYNSFLQGSQEQIYWFCYIGILILGVGFIMKNSSIVLSQLNIIAIACLIWTFDFFYIIFTGETILGIADYFFVPGNWLPKFVSLQHLYTVPVALYVLSKTKVQKKGVWIYSYAQMLFIFIITHQFTSSENNINCVFRSCVDIFQLETFYPWAWLITSLVMVLVVNYLIMKLPFLKS